MIGFLAVEIQKIGRNIECAEALKESSAHFLRLAYARRTDDVGVGIKVMIGSQEVELAGMGTLPDEDLAADTRFRPPQGFVVHSLNVHRVFASSSSSMNSRMALGRTVVSTL